MYYRALVPMWSKGASLFEGADSLNRSWEMSGGGGSWGIRVGEKIV